MKIVSACLAGINCRYDGNSNSCEKVIEMVKNGEAIPICPEQLGGLSTPRRPVQIVNGKCISETGEDFTEAFKIGANEALKIAKLVEANEAILKQNSPSCGSSQIYDGSFSGSKIKGQGICAKLFSDNGIHLSSEEDYL